jgi:peptidoglycan biosynthesis protein MviN/MurJ (putative lipid II flippase)
VDFFALFVIFRLRYGRIGGRQIFNSFAKIALCSAIMGVACWFGMHYTEFTRHSRFLVQLLTFLALLGGATLLYLGTAWLFRCHELEEIYGIATRRRSPADAGYAEP